MKSLMFLGIIQIICCFCSCSSIKHQSPRYVHLAHKITNEAGRQLEKEKGLILVGTGGEMMYDIQMMMMGFDFYQEVTIENARELLLFSVETYLNEINNSEEVRKYLHNYPFTEENVEIVVYFHKKNGHDVSGNNIAIAAARKGSLIYYTDSPDKIKLNVVLREDFTEQKKHLN
jgi:hypothetical protein